MVGYLTLQYRDYGSLHARQPQQGRLLVLMLLDHYCHGKRFVKVLTQDSVLLNGVIAFVITHSHA